MVLSVSCDFFELNGLIVFQLSILTNKKSMARLYSILLTKGSKLFLPTLT